MSQDYKAQAQLRVAKKDDLDELEQKIQGVKDEISKIFEQKNQVKEEYYKQKYLYEVQEEEVKQVDFILKRKEKLQKDKEYKEKRDQEERDK